MISCWRIKLSWRGKFVRHVRGKFIRHVRRGKQFRHVTKFRHRHLDRRPRQKTEQGEKGAAAQKIRTHLFRLRLIELSCRQIKNGNNMAQ